MASPTPAYSMNPSQSPVPTPQYVKSPEVQIVSPDAQVQAMYQIPMQQAYMPQAYMPQTTVTTQSRYKSATPIAALGRSAAPVDCPACGHRELTLISYEAGNTTHVWGAALCITLCLGCLPYVMNQTKDIQHKCGSCDVLMATWHRSGTTETHIHG